MIFAAVKPGRKSAAADCAEDDGEKRERFEDAVAARQQMRLHDFRHGAVLGRHEESAVHAHAEDGGHDD